MKLIKKAVITVAGKGTRIMPLTLHQPKAMVGVSDRPIIHHILDEIITAGIREIIVVTGPNQPEFKKYFEFLKNGPKWRQLEIKLSLVIQPKPRGNGDAILAAEKLVGHEPFLLCFGDDLLSSGKPTLGMLVKKYKQLNAPLLTLEALPWSDISRYGVVKTGLFKNGVGEIKDVVEKPDRANAPSNLTIVGRYVLTPDIFSLARQVAQHAPPEKEVYLADALKLKLKTGGKIFGWQFHGERFDCGSKIGLLKANVHFGCRHPEYGADFRKYLKKSNG